MREGVATPGIWGPASLDAAASQLPARDFSLTDRLFVSNSYIPVTTSVLTKPESLWLFTCLAVENEWILS